MVLVLNSNRRERQRSYQVFPVIVRGIGANGQKIKVSSLTDNFSSSGLFMQLAYEMQTSSQLFMVVYLPGNLSFAATGRVVRTEEKNCGLVGTAVCFKQTRLLVLESAQAE